VAEVGCRRLDVGDLDIEYLALVPHDLTSSPPSAARTYEPSGQA
jgi:hypothetical protein